jgi:uncharacterized protein YdeI (YjbR/CyaY-like superfamily)
MATRRLPAKPAADLPVLAFRKAADWAAWLKEHHAAPGLWLKIAKKDSGTASITYPEAVEHALAWGWIDGQKKPPILYRVHAAKRPETRAARIAQFVGMLANHETLHPSRAALKGAKDTRRKSP